MAFDAGFTQAVVFELQKIVGARIEKIYQPERDSVVLSLKCAAKDGVRGESVKLYVSGSASTPGIYITSLAVENPKVPPMFCMLLRKHLGSGKLLSVTTPGFERIVKLEFESHDEMGFATRRSIIVEIMGKYSNLIFTDEAGRIISAVKTTDFSETEKCRIFPGMIYREPDKQDGKIDPLTVTREDFLRMREEFSSCDDDKFVMSRFYGISPLVAREIAYRASDAGKLLWESFSYVTDAIKNHDFTPVLLKSADDVPQEFSFIPITQYGSSMTVSYPRDFGELCDIFFFERARASRLKQRAADVLKIVSGAEKRLTKKLGALGDDLAACAEKDKFKLYGDLVTANMYKLQRGMSTARLTDYSDENLREVTVVLDGTLTPSANAQRYYKKYNKAKKAEVALREQLDVTHRELEYITTVAESLSKAETEADITEIRRELHESGYASKMKGYVKTKEQTPKPLEFVSSGGYKILCGKNNSQNDYITHKLARKGDLWFHVKGMPGSHVVLFCDGEEPSSLDYTEAATIAAAYSKAPRGAYVDVDYTRVKNIKKPPASRPGYVTYSENYTAHVTADENAAKRLLKK